MIQHDGCLVVDSAGPGANWMVLVHGVSQDHRIFAAQVEDFRDSYQILLIDLPGHGVSSHIRGPYGLAAFAEHIRTRAAAFGVKDAIFWGTHLGASAGLLAACNRPKLFSVLVLESPVFPGRVLPSVSDLLSQVAKIAKVSGMKNAREHWWKMGPWFDRMRSEPKRYRAAEHLKIIEDFDGGPWLETGLVSKPLECVEEMLQRLSTPTILVNGEHDVGDFLKAADALDELIPNTRRITVPGGGGFPLWEVPEVVNGLVAQALRDITNCQ